jgi:hypothetical protein
VSHGLVRLVGVALQEGGADLDLEVGVQLEEDFLVLTRTRLFRGAC